MDEELVPTMSTVGWFVIETIERMLNLCYSVPEICDVLDLPTHEHMFYLLEWARREREELIDGLLSE